MNYDSLITLAQKEVSERIDEGIIFGISVLNADWPFARKEGNKRAKRILSSNFVKSTNGLWWFSHTLVSKVPKVSEQKMQVCPTRPNQ